MDGTNTSPTAKNSLQQTQTFIHILLHIRFYTTAIHEQSGNHKPLGISLSLSLDRAYSLRSEAEAAAESRYGKQTIRA